MRILVVSDTHGDADALRRAILAQPKAETVIHLGDGEEETDRIRGLFPEKEFLQVCGNCDWGSTLPAEGLAEFGGKTIFYTHGNIYNVKYGTDNFISAARERKADIALFGHTHVPVTEYEGGLYVMNPGSLRGSAGTYGVVDITRQGIVLNLMKLI